MRKVIYCGANSVDNFITGPNVDVGWLRASGDSQQIVKASWQGVDTMLMGRKTWDFAVQHGRGAAMTGIRTLVFSRTLESVPEGIELIREDAAEFVRAFKAEPGGNIFLMGGGELGSALIEAGLVDEIGLNIHPLLLGQGTPLFRPMSGRIELQLIEARAIAEGCVHVRWRVVQ